MVTGNANQGPNVESMYDQMFGRWSSNDVTNVLGNMELSVDEKLRQDGATKQQLLTQPGNSKMYLSQLLMNLSLENQPGVKNSTTEEERIRHNRISFLTTLAMKNALSNDALAMYIHKHKLKEAMAAYRSYIRNKSAEDFDRLLRADIEAREKMDALMEERIREMLAQIQREIDEAMEYHDRMMNHHEGRATAARERINEIIEEHIEEYKNELNSVMSQSPAAEIWNQIPEDKKDEYIRESLTETIDFEMNNEIRLHEISGKEQQLQDVNDKIQEMEQNYKSKVPQIQPKPTSTGEFRTVTPQYIKDKTDQNGLVKDPQYKLLLKDKDMLVADLSKLKQEHKDAEVTHKEHQSKLRDSKFGDAMVQMRKLDPNIDKRMDQVHNVHASKVHEKTKEHKLEFVGAKKEVVNLKVDKEKEDKKVSQVYGNVGIPKPRKIARLD